MHKNIVSSMRRSSGAAMIEENDLSRLQLLLLTCSTGGLQVVWSTIMSNGTPFLITLGLPESMTALVWVVAPLCGVIVQPYVGMLSDQCKYKMGRRRPFILAGAMGTIICILGLASARTTMNFWIKLLGGNIHSNASVTIRIVTAVLWLLGLNFFIQPFQGGIRALIVDACPASQQAEANAFASLMTGAGNIIGYLFGYLSLKDWIGLRHVSQFTFLSAVAAIIVGSTVALTCCFIREKNPIELAGPQDEQTSFLSKMHHLVWSIKSLPSIVRQVCVVQFFAWLGWFPFLFYISSYIGNLYAAPRLVADAHMSSDRQALVIEDAVRAGSLASLCFALVAFVSNVALPKWTRDHDEETDPDLGLPRDRRFSITRVWSSSLWLFAILMFATIVSPSRPAATVLVACAGLSWACTLWIPFTIIGRDLAERRAMSTKVMQGELQPNLQDQAGVVMGLHNCAISAPQIVAALLSSLIFWMAQRLAIDDGIGWVLRLAAIASLIAGWLARKLDS